MFDFSSLRRTSLVKIDNDRKKFDGRRQSTEIKAARTGRRRPCRVVPASTCVEHLERLLDGSPFAGPHEACDLAAVTEEHERGPELDAE